MRLSDTLFDIRARIALLLLVFATATAVADELRVVASIPDLGVIAERIGGDLIEVRTLASGREDFHGVPARPSFIPLLNRADLLLTLGLDAEHSWLPPLAAEARNEKVMEDHRAWVEVYDGIEILDVPTVISRSEGEQHAEGNPHFNVGPHCWPTMAENVAYALMGAAPELETDIDAALTEYLAEIETVVAELKSRGAPLQGIPVISYHADVSYLARFYGLRVVGTLEPKPGIEPTARHLARLARASRSEGVRLIIYHQAQSAKLPKEFAKRTGATSVRFANMVGAREEIDTCSGLHEYNLQALLAALNESGEADDR
ncbi:MAG: zinc ABC transporter substrate-binding protein [bacterium]|nr:zinc ABC transporter substrate-binding protein [bacterium]